MENNKNKDPRFKIIHKEAIVTLGLYVVFFLWWYLTAYGFSEGGPESYNYIFGLPEWFFYSCIVGYVLISIILAIVIKFIFKDISIESDDNHAD